jgi:HD-GYP domain-containing protein (c-di-GMP phosphodiesterase class II)
MLKRIPTDQLRRGMHLHELCGSWMDHPFWRAKFVIQTDEQVRSVVNSGIKECWIDTSKGLDVEGGLSEEEVAEQVERELEHAATAPLPLIDLPPLMRPPEIDEHQRAAMLVRQSKQKVISLFREARMGKAIDAESCLPLVDEITASVTRNPGALVSIARLKTRDEYTYMHSVAVCALMVALGRQLRLPEDQIREAGLAGMLHDMGKALMPLGVLNKPGRLTDEEFAIMKAHPVKGHELLVEGRGATAMALDVCLHHHEKVDGSGYPHRLPGEKISLFAKMGAVCDVYDAITSQRPYKNAWDPGEAIRQMAQWKGHFDPVIFQAFVKSVGIYPVGTLVKLQSGRLAVVITQNERSLLTPVVKAFFSLKSNLRIIPETIDLAAPRVADRIVSVESPERWGFKDVDAMWAGDAAPRTA